MKHRQSFVLHGNDQTFSEYSHLSPIFATSTFVFENADEGMQRFKAKTKRNIYSRWSNPTCEVAAEMVAQLESFNTQAPIQPLKALLQASGQGAMTSLFLSVLKKGDAILSHFSLYGGTHELITQTLPSLGMEVHITDFHDLNGMEKTLKENKNILLIHIETPSNPTLQCLDIQSIVALANKYNKKVSVDNTFATPYLQQPFLMGVDFVVHSTTKFLNGHGTSIGGVWIGKDIEFMETIGWKKSALLGATPSPFDAYLLINGIKTLPLRMEQHCKNAMQVAHYLSTHPAIKKVNYLGLPSHPDYALAQNQMQHPGALLSFELKDGFDAAKKFINRVQLCKRAVSLGTLDTLVCHPASMTHVGMSQKERLVYHISDELVRMSVGIEHIEDILQDIQQAL